MEKLVIDEDVIGNGSEEYVDVSEEVRGSKNKQSEVILLLF